MEDDDLDTRAVKAMEILNSPDDGAIEEMIVELESSRHHQVLYRFCKRHYPDELSLRLFHLLLNSNNPDIKSNCADRLYSLFDSPRFWNSTSNVTRGELKIAILEILKQDNPTEISETMWIIASVIFGYIIKDQGEWEDMLKFFVESLIWGKSDIQDYAVRFFVELPTCLREELRDPNPKLQAKSLKALASIARSSKGLFYKCYDLAISSLKKLLANATSISAQDNAVELHLDKAVECIWSVATAVGKDKIKKDATEVMALLLSVRWCLGEDDHSLKVALIQLLLCLGSHFYPYVKDIVPNLLRYARTPLTLFTQHSVREFLYSARERVILTEKIMACKLLLCLARQFEGDFFPWIDQVFDIMVELVKFHEANIRKIAFSAMPKLLLSVKLSIEKKQVHGATNSYLHKLVLRIVPSLLAALDEDIDGEICAKIVKALTKCIEIAGGFLSKKKIQQTANAIEKVLKATSSKKFSEEEDVTDLERRIIQMVVNYILTLMEIYEESAWTLVDKLLACINSMMEDDVTAKEKEIALLIFKEISQKCKEAGIRLFEAPIIWKQRKPSNA